MDYQNPTHLERTAIHEAGHGVVASFQECLPAVRYLCLGPAAGGHCQLEPPEGALAATQGSSSARQELLEQAIRVSAAGYVAERIAFGRAEIGRDTDSASCDTASLVKLATLIDAIKTPDFHATARKLAEAATQRRAASSPSPPVSRGRLGRLLEITLAGTPSPIQPARFDERAQRAVTRRVLECVERASTVAEFLLRSRWGAVELVARHLIECQTIPGELVRTLIDTAPAPTRLSQTAEQDARLIARAAASDPALGATILRALEKAA